MSYLKNISDDDFRIIVSNSHNLSEIARQCKLSTNGTASFIGIKRRIGELNCDCSHFRKPEHLFKKKIIDIKQCLTENSAHSRGTIKGRLIEENILENRCAICRLESEWQGRKLVLVLDHINGINNDHRLENLRLLCPNCNSQTDTFTSKKLKKQNKCLNCNKSINKKSVRCTKCSAMSRHNTYYCSKGVIRKSKKPEKEVLKSLLWAMPSTKIGKMYEVSSKAVEKWAKSYNLSKPPRGYWEKIYHSPGYEQKDLMLSLIDPDA